MTKRMHRTHDVCDCRDMDTFLTYESDLDFCLYSSQLIAQQNLSIKVILVNINIEVINDEEDCISYMLFNVFF